MPTTNFSGEIETGRAVVSTTAVQLPDVQCKQVVLRAIAGGVITLGTSDSVTGTTGFTITATVPSPPIPVDNLSQIWAISDTIDHAVEFLAIR